MLPSADIFSVAVMNSVDDINDLCTKQDTSGLSFELEENLPTLLDRDQNTCIQMILVVHQREHLGWVKF